MDPLGIVKVLLVAFVTLFPVVNPVGDAPIFLALTSQYPQSVREIWLGKLPPIGFAPLAGSFLFASIVLDFFSIRLFVIEISGGLVLAITGWDLLNQSDGSTPATQSSRTLEAALEHAFFPLTLPITVGPGCVAIAVTLGAHLRHQSEPGWEHVFPRTFSCRSGGHVSALCPRYDLLQQY